MIKDDFSEDDEVKSEFNLWEYKADNAEIIGIITDIDEEGMYGLTYTIDNGEAITLPSLTALTPKLSNAKIGDKVKIVSLGLAQPKQRGGKPYYDFQVFIKAM